MSGDRIEENAIGDENVEEGYYKMTFVVNTALKMGVGKLSAQVRDFFSCNYPV